jgi:preprotein translocase subunit SecA
MLTKAIRRAQKKVEQRNFEIRKRLLQYDSVMAKQREAIYSLRNKFLLGQKVDIDEYMKGLLESYAESLVEKHTEDGELNIKTLKKELFEFQNFRFDEGNEDTLTKDGIYEFLVENYRRQASRLGEQFSQLAQFMILQIIDENWRRHLYELDELREGISWRSYSGRDPLIEFTKESFILFQGMLERIEEQIINYLVKPRLEIGEYQPKARELEGISYRHPQVAAQAVQAAVATKKKPRRVVKVGRNDPCPCGSGRKYKHCCGR